MMRSEKIFTTKNHCIMKTVKPRILVKPVTAILCFITLLAASPAAAGNRDGRTLRILAIGNSFSDDAMEYLPALLADMGIDNVELARLYVGGCTLEQHARFHIEGKAPYDFYRSKAGENKWVKHPEKVSMRHALALGEWDIITMQQASGYSGRYESYQPYLDCLIGIVRAAQPHARLAWHMTWAYSTDSTHGQFADYGRDQRLMFDAICSAVRETERHTSAFSVIIPSGTAIQSLRDSDINDAPKDLTRDGYHMDLGAGRYALACMWYESLIKPFAGKSMRGNALRMAKGEVEVDDRVAAYCQKAARKAVRRKFKARRITCRRTPAGREQETTFIK